MKYMCRTHHRGVWRRVTFACSPLLTPANGRSSMLGHLSIRDVSLALCLCTVVAAFVFGSTGLYLYDAVRRSTALQQEFYSTVRRMIVTIGIFVIPVVVYF